MLRTSLASGLLGSPNDPPSPDAGLCIALREMAPRNRRSVGTQASNQTAL